MNHRVTVATLLALVIWGHQTESLYLAALLGLPLLLSLFRRWPGKVTDSQFQALGDFTLVSLIVVYVLMINEIEPRREASRTFLFAIPLIFYPLALCRFLLAQGSVRMAHLVILTRFQTLGFSRFGDIRLDFAWPYAFLVLLGSCVPEGDKAFLTFPLLTAWCVVVVVLTHHSRGHGLAKAMLLLAGLGIGWCFQFGIQGAEAYIQKQSAEWWKQGIVDPGLEKRATMLGKTAELQLSSKVHLRVQLNREPKDAPFYLRSSTYDQWSGRDLWLNSLDPRPALPGPSGHYSVHSRELIAEVGEPLGELWMEMRGQGWLNLPEDTGAFLSPSLVEVERVGDEHFRGKSENDVVVVELFEKIEASAENSVPEEEVLGRYLEMNPLRKKTSLEFLAKHKMESLSKEELPLGLKAIFLGSNYTYSLEVESPPKGRTVLDHFLNHVRSGHCEYYATATVMLLRSKGIPARYCTGYMVHEREEDLWIARGRDAHAWAEMWNGRSWVRVETTPPTQFGELSFRDIRRTWESWMFVLDKWRYGSGGDRLADYAPWFLILVLTYFGWRFSKEWREGRRKERIKKRSLRRDPGFINIERRLEKRQLGRYQYESWWMWRSRLMKEGVELPQHLCDSWNRWSWDPEFEAPKELEQELRSFRLESRS